MHPSILPPWCLLQPTNHSAQFAACWSTKNEHVRKPQTLANIKCWPTFWTHDRLLFANIVGKHILANICWLCVRSLRVRVSSERVCVNDCHWICVSGCRCKVRDCVTKLGVCAGSAQAVSDVAAWGTEAILSWFFASLLTYCRKVRWKKAVLGNLL